MMYFFFDYAQQETLYFFVFEIIFFSTDDKNVLELCLYKL